MLWDLLMLTYNISVLIQLTLMWEFYEILQWDCLSDEICANENENAKYSNRKKLKKQI